MGRKGTTIAMLILAAVTALPFGLFGLILVLLGMAPVLYLIWVDSYKPDDQQFRYYNSEHYKKRHNKK